MDKILDIDNENKKIINITVEEKPTGEIMAGAGVGTGGGTLFLGEDSITNNADIAIKGSVLGGGGGNVPKWEDSYQTKRGHANMLGKKGEKWVTGLTRGSANQVW